LKMKLTSNVALCLAVLLVVVDEAAAGADSVRTRRGWRPWGKPASEEEEKSSMTAVILWLVAVSSTMAVIFGLVAVGALYLIKAKQKKQRCLCVRERERGRERECVCVKERRRSDRG
jgi:hypothetical protein